MANVANALIPWILTWKTILPVFVGLLTSYYLFSIVRKPLIVISNGKLKNFINNHINTLKRPFYPTPWAINGHLQTIFRAVFEKSPELDCRRETITTSTGIQLAIDWLCIDQHDDYKAKPIVLYVPGIGGNSKPITSGFYIMQHDYIKDDISLLICNQGKPRSNCLYAAKSMGYRVAVYCIRGNDGLMLSKPSQLPRIGDWIDLAAIIDHIHQQYPNAMINVIGVSLGGMVICNYLAEIQPARNFVCAAYVVSTPFDMNITRLSLETWFNTRMYNVYLAEFMIKYLRDHEALFIQNGYTLPFKLEDIDKCTTFSQFDQCVVLPLFGYPNLATYYKLASPGIRIDKIKTPLVCVNAVDDPFSPAAGIPMDKFNHTSDIALILTNYGGHVGFIEGLWPTGTTYADKVCVEFLRALLESHNELC